MRTPSPRWIATLLAVIVIGSLVAACSSSASTRTETGSGEPATTAVPVTLPTSIPAGTTLRIGDQLDYLKIVLGLAGEDKDFPYQVEYSAFIGGPPMLQAFQAGALDTGFVGSTPLIFAQAGNQDILAVAGFGPPNSSYGLLTSPGNTEINGWADLKGKKVAYQQGTAGEAVLLQALDSVGLALSDVTPVLLPQTQVSSALQGGSADAGISVEPLTSVYLEANPTAREVAKAKEITDRSSFIIATQGALDDAGKSAALGDYIARLVRSFKYLANNPDKIVQAVYVDQYKLSPERAAAVVKATGVATFFPIPGEVGPAQQRLADLFQAAGEIPTKVDVTKEFDPRFNDLVTKVQGS